MLGAQYGEYYASRISTTSLRYAHYEILEEDKSFYGEIPSFQGVYASAPTLETCREQLEEVLEEWVLFRIHKNLPLPQIDGIELNHYALKVHRLLLD